MSEQTAGGKGIGEQLKTLFPFDFDLLRHAGAEPVPYHLKKWWFCLGGTPMYLFIVQIITGIALAFYYVPSPDQAYASVAAITNEIRFGWYIRSLHKWSSNLMIIAVFLHLLRVYFTGAYRHPRQLNWCIGIALLGTTMAFGFTGYSLVYEQLSYWGATVAANLAEATPLIGPYIAHFMRGGTEIGANTLTRFFILHIGVLPTAVFILLGLHVTLIRLHGVTELHFEDEEVKAEHRHFRFFPEHVTTELIIGVLLMYLLTILALIFPAGLGQQADPSQTPAHIKPEWYFYFNFRLLKLTSLRLSVVLTMGIGAIAFFWPFIEGWLKRRFRMPDAVSVLIGVLAFLCFLAFTVWESLAV
ncbi:MAG: cytochrome bc complex cytochrome b subunit [Gemmatimonadetes bacterium]|jgi:ubiquinol-cytochrome c reductase cytochrome b subunit/cytochrome b6|nr:cytochrome bc complex cytochrome b subunit [Gemmatimonadota bacterium]